VKKLKIMTIVGTRPEIIKLCRVIAELDKHTDHILVHTGQNYAYELNEIFFAQLQVRKPNYFLEAAKATASQTTAEVIAATDRLLMQEKPDAVLILGDTNSAMSAYAAKRRHIPIFHMEAGNRCFDQRVPEELNRKLVDHMSDINLPYSEQARTHLLREGLPADCIIKTGSPMYEVLQYYRDAINRQEIVNHLGLQSGKYFVVSTHREENVDVAAHLASLLHSFNALAEQYHYPIIVSTHPRTQERLNGMAHIVMNPLIQFVKAMGFLEYIQLQQNAVCVISDSGTISEEASILNFPAVNIRETHERHEGMEETVVIMAGLQPLRILQAVDIAMQQHAKPERAFQVVHDYSAPNVSKKIVRIIYSYVDYVNRHVWYQS
jgi:UDP-N-acetylglucosamine 2-epimerase